MTNLPPWSGTFWNALVVEPRFSPLLATLLLCGHVGAFVLALVGIPAIELRVISIAAVAVSLACCCRQLFGQSGDARLARVVWSPDNRWAGYGARDNPLPTLRLGGYFVSPWLISLRFRTASGPLHLTLTRDALAPDVFRRLRARLRALPPVRP